MRTYLLIIALATLAAAQATQPGIATQIINLPDTIKTTINDISYSLVKQRTNLPQITVALPAAAYKDYGNIKLIVIAIPYSPEEDPDQAISKAISELIDVSKDFDKRVSDAINHLLSIRSVFYPYETFRVELIFIMFVNTQTLIDYAIEASKDLLTGEKSNPDAAATLYTNSIMEILNTKYRKWLNSNKPQLENKIRSFTLRYQVSENTIQFTGYAGEESAISFSVTVTLQVNEKIEGDKTIITCDLFSAVDYKYEKFTEQLLSTLPTLTQNEINRVFAGRQIDKEIFNSEIRSYYRNIIDNVKEIIRPDIEEYIIRSFTENRPGLVPSDSCEELKNQFINSILQKKDIAESYIKFHYELMLSLISSRISNDLNVINQIKESLMPDCKDDSCNNIKNEYQNVAAYIDLGQVIDSEIASVATSCLTSYLSSAIQTGVNSIISTVPGVNLVYMAANGILGALQNVITIEGTIVSSPAELKGFQLAGGLKAFKVYNVSSQVACYSSHIRDISGKRFVSGPSLAEAVLAGIKGFFSAIVQLYAPNVGKAANIIPIVRKVTIPQNGYFMFGSTPGVYVLSIKDLNARSVVDNIITSIKNGIQNGLKQSYEKGSSNSLYKKINERVKAVLGQSDGNFAEFYNKVYGGNYDYNSRANDNSLITLNLTFIVIPPYMIGQRPSPSHIIPIGSIPTADFFGVLRSSINYIPTADFFGLLRSFFFPAIGNIRQKMIQTLLQPQSASADFCSQGDQPSSTSTSTESFITSSCSNAVNTLTKNMLKPIVDKIVNVIVSNINNVGAGPRGQSPDQCSVQGLLFSITEKTIDNFKSYLKDKINQTVFNDIITPLSNKIAHSICAPLGDAVKRLAGEKLSSLFGDLLGAYGASFLQVQTPDLTGGVCRSIGGSQTIRYLGLYATRLFDAAEEGLYVPSYFLSVYPIKFKESPTARWCYGAVASPYFVYVQPPPPATDSEKKQILIGALDVIRKTGYLQDKFYNFLRANKMKLSFFVVSWEIHAAKENRLVACNSSFIGVKWHYYIFPELVVNPYGDYSWCLERGNLVWTINSLETMIDNVGLFDALSILRGQRIVDLPVLVGVNKYFDALQVYPAMAVREDGNPNPYYFVVPYSTPARELFVLGTVGDVVMYDGGLRGSGGGKPFLYYDVSR
jgi:hypothetical protein